MTAPAGERRLLRTVNAHKANDFLIVDLLKNCD
jgi:hypothetical protein